MKAINTTVLQAVNQYSELELLSTFVAGLSGEETADSELIIKTGQVIRVKKNSDEWPALITIRTDETPPQQVCFYDNECISIVYPDPDTAYFKNLAAELQELISNARPEILTGKQARKKYNLEQLKRRQAVIITEILGDGSFTLGAGPVALGRDGEIALFVDTGNGDLMGVFNDEQFALLPELSTVSVDKLGGAA